MDLKDRYDGSSLEGNKEEKMTLILRRDNPT